MDPVIRRYLLLLVLVLGLVPAPPAKATDGLTVAAAADLMAPLQELARRYEARTHRQVTVTFGATRLLERQIAEGAPVDLFCAADRASLASLAQAGEIVPGSVRIYARGRLVIWTQDAGVGCLHDLQLPSVRRVAIADPAVAPYGMAAKQALLAAGLWRAIAPKLVYGENVRQAIQFAQSGNADAALVSASVTVGEGGRIVPLHAPLLAQALGIVRDSHHRAEARAFAAFLLGADARRVFAAYGYLAP